MGTVARTKLCSRGAAPLKSGAAVVVVLTVVAPAAAIAAAKKISLRELNILRH